MSGGSVVRAIWFGITRIPRAATFRCVMPIVDGWISWAIQAPGISDKIYTAPNRGLGIVGHSIVGSYQAALGRFMSEARDAAGRYTPYAAASVMFILCQDGALIQMYDIWASTWTTGGPEANTSYWAVEAEGGPPANPSEAFTPAQQATFLRLCEEYRTHTGSAVVPGTTFREHGELAAELGYAPTACPSHRYDWFKGLEDDMGMTPAELARLERLEDLLAGNGIAKDLAKPDERTTGNDALEYAWKQGWSAFLGIGLVTQNLAVHELVDHDGTPGESVTVVIPGGKVLPS